MKYSRRWIKSLTAYPIPSATLPLIPSAVSQLALGYCLVLIKEEYYTYEGKSEGKVSTIHQCLWDQKRNYLFACAQGRINGFGQMRALRYDHESGSFTQTAQFLSRTWDEPRHASVHPNNRWVYMCEEKGNKVLYFQFDEKTGSMEAMQELTTVPETVTGYSDASEVMIDPAGRWCWCPTAIPTASRSTELTR